jgi:hypothetical protein
VNRIIGLQARPCSAEAVTGKATATLSSDRPTPQTCTCSPDEPEYVGFSSELATAAVNDLPTRPADDLDRAAKFVLEKNRELVLRAARRWAVNKSTRQDGGACCLEHLERAASCNQLADR